MIQGEHTMRSWDGTELFYRSWRPEKSTASALLLFHRGHEHSGRWAEFVELLKLDDLSIFALDARGHGRSAGERGWAPNFSATVKDIDAFARHVSEREGIALVNVIAVGHSLGAVALAAWVHDYAPAIRAMILVTAAFRIKLYVPLALPALRLKQRVMGPGYLRSYVRAKMLTHDPVQAALYEADPLIFRQIAINVLLDVHDASSRLLADAEAIDIPTLMIGAGSDWVVSLDAQRRFFDRLSSPMKRMHVFPAAYHAMFHEVDRMAVVDRVREFIVDRFKTAPAATSLVESDKFGATWEEHERLKLRGGPQFVAVRAGLRLAGKFSRGIALGWKEGFDSGRSLDYVYQNEPQGTNRVGRLIDRGYLNSIGWRGIRQRRLNLEAALRRAIEMTKAEQRPTRIVDIAAGPGRYVMDVLNSLRDDGITAVLRDSDSKNVEAARALARDLNLASVTVEQGDAFDRASLTALYPRPTIAIVSGLYELFPSNKPVTSSLAGLADAVENGGFLIYTNQPWHPQIEFIARVLRNREGKPWIMRRRTTGEIDQLVSIAGFQKLEMEIDEWGMFTVSIARRVIK